ncbi:hypothetical protein Q5752_006108 [Cryptotrichosporon argae]
MTVTPLNVAIVGAGPGGLAASINLRRLDNVRVSVYDQASELREVGAGISINQNTWRLLGELGAAAALDAYYTRGVDGAPDTEHRNGRTGAVLARTAQTADPSRPPRSRVERYKLQNALLSQIPRGFVRLGKKLKTIDEQEDGVRLGFADGSIEGPFDLVVGADGIRSAVRQYAFPEHKLAYTGKVAYRVIIPADKVAHVADVPAGACFWHTPTTHVYTNPLEGGLFELATRASEPDEHGQKVSWGQVVPKSQVVHHYEGYCETIRQLIDAPEEWLEFAMFGGPRLESVTHNGRIALIGDASHPLSGAFGSGAAFAFEDAYVLSQTIAYALENGKPLASALKLFDDVRHPRYKGLYEILDRGIDNVKDVTSQHLSPDEHVRETVERNWKGGEQGGWIYGYNVTEVWREALAAHEKGDGTAAAKVATTRTTVASVAKAAPAAAIVTA